jgi:electron transport complex protein RnfD
MMDKLRVSVSPHIKKPEDVPRIMADVIIALIPATVVGAVLFGLSALLVVVYCTGAAILFEAIFCKIRGRELTIRDLSAAVTGLLLALNLPSSAPLWLCMIGSLVAIGIGKCVFGGLGSNPFNPALVGRVFLLISFPLHMTTWPVTQFMQTDAVTCATPLAIVKEGAEGAFTYLDLFLGNTGGCIGETSALALLIGALYLLVRRVISWHIPISYIVTVALFSAIFGRDPLFHILAGGLIIGAFFMATDYVTSPLTPKAQILFGIGCGIITMVIRLFGGYPEGVSFSILLMNATVPLLNRWRILAPRRFGC